MTSGQLVSAQDFSSPSFRKFRKPLDVVVFTIILLILWQAARFVFALPAYKLPDPLALLTGFFDSTPRGFPVFLSLAYDALVTWSVEK